MLRPVAFPKAERLGYWRCRSFSVDAATSSNVPTGAGSVQSLQTACELCSPVLHNLLLEILHIPSLNSRLFCCVLRTIVKTHVARAVAKPPNNQWRGEQPDSELRHHMGVAVSYKKIKQGLG